MNLTKDTTYRGRGIVSTFVGVSHENAKATLEGKGFTNVKIWLKGDKLPDDWRKDAISDESGMLSTQVWAEMTWAKENSELPDSGTGYEIIQPVWEVATSTPGDTTEENTCLTEGYSCDPSWSNCCSSFVCQQDTENRYGLPGYPSGNRCMPAPVQPTPQGSSWGWWALGIVGVAGAVGVAWWVVRK